MLFSEKLLPNSAFFEFFSGLPFFTAKSTRLYVGMAYEGPA